MSIKKHHKAFTLIELLVTISIIALLSTIVFAGFDEARKQARDKTRMTSLKELQLAIEQYRAQTGRYPAAGCGAGQTRVSPGPKTDNFTVTCDLYITGLVPDYISALPKDPNQEYDTNKGIYYNVDNDGTVYKVGFLNTVESLFITSYDDDFARCPSDPGAGPCDNLNSIASTYAVYSQGAEDW